jgi:hypothetical protein
LSPYFSDKPDFIATNFASLKQFMVQNNDAVDSQASKFLQRLKNKQVQSGASPYFFQVAIDQFVLIPKTHLSKNIRESTFFATSALESGISGAVVIGFCPFGRSDGILCMDPFDYKIDSKSPLLVCPSEQTFQGAMAKLNR